MPYADPEKARACSRAHYRRNKPAYKARARAHTVAQRPLLRQTIWKYLEEHPCVDCGESDPRVLEFDHRDDSEKSFNVADALRKVCSVARLMAEIAKCDVRCANCHRRRTYESQGWHTM